MSIRAFAAHLGVAVASVTNWEQRGEMIRLRDETQEILDRDLSRATEEVRSRFAAALDADQMISGRLPRDGAQRLEYVLANPGSVDLVTVAHLREQVAALDAQYDRAPAAALLGIVGERHGQIMFLRTHATRSRVLRDLNAAAAESATLMGQLLWDASMRRDNATALAYLDQAVDAAGECGDPIAAGRAQLRRSYVAIYGQKDPAAGAQMATQAAATSRSNSNVLAGLALLHAAEAHAMRQQRRPCERLLRAAEGHFGKVDSQDEASLLFSPVDLSRMAGSCYLSLGDANQATRFLSDTLSTAGRTKAAAVAAANLSLAYIQQHAVSAAVHSLHQAIDITESTRGGGGLTVAFTAGRALSPWRNTAEVQDVQDRLLTLMAA
ncbi:transcriptional regulator [Micromonospora sp. LOL_023]|uniref:transcriptional regulator n=1 Tax=Micromonospora sp. LOL_023 TaxID=3345418 RepID=UPI003A897C00